LLRPTLPRQQVYFSLFRVTPSLLTAFLVWFLVSESRDTVAECLRVVDSENRVGGKFCKSLIHFVRERCRKMNSTQVRFVLLSLK